MAWRFQASKFKNTTPRPPKKEDTIFDLPIGNLSSTDNGVQSSTKHLAFHIDGDVDDKVLYSNYNFKGGKLGVLPLGTKGRRLRKDISVVCAHSGQCLCINNLEYYFLNLERFIPLLTTNVA
uniref:DUF1899 domain-containing protein n=1 Tax=Heterorhabditis bacteriophora TaxID=37862 RepID=A0A1I7WW12_HETBA